MTSTSGCAIVASVRAWRRKKDEQDPLDSPLSPDQRRTLQQRSDRRGWRGWRHLAAIGGTGWIYGASSWQSAPPLAAGGPAADPVRLHAGDHVRGHARAGAPHRFQEPVAQRRRGMVRRSALRSTTAPFTGTTTAGTTASLRSPAAIRSWRMPKPHRPAAATCVELSGLPWWIGKLRTHLAHRPRAGRLLRVPERQDPTAGGPVGAPAAVGLWRAIALSIALGQPLFVTFWLLPVAAGQPLLRAILLAEHTGCSEDDDPYANTRTTHTLLPVRFLMWDMPYHAEHHRYPALPFFALCRRPPDAGPRASRTSRARLPGLSSRAGPEPRQARGARPRTGA